MGQKEKQKEQYEYIAAINQHCKSVCLSLSKTNKKLFIKKKEILL
jgi:hypothetical protein